MPTPKPFDPSVIPPELTRYKPHDLPRQSVDRRDYRAKAIDGRAGLDIMPPAWSIPQATPVQDQGYLGSCVGFAVTAMLENLAHRIAGRTIRFSPLQAYYAGRVIDGTTGIDTGTWTRSALKGLQRWGAVPDELWGASKSFSEMPDARARFQGAFNQGFRYVAVESLDDLRSSIAQGYGAVFILPLYESFYRNAYLGIIPYPSDPYEGSRGAHALFAVGYDDAKRTVRCKNSWGTGKGDGGYFEISYDYWTHNDTWDQWSVRPL